MTACTRLATVAFALASPLAAPALAEVAAEDRRARGAEVIRSLNDGQAQPTLENLRRDFPFLADSIEGFALGEVWARPELDSRTRQMLAVAMFAALNNPALLKTHAGYALNVGVTEDELKEVVYLSLVPAGVPSAIAAAQALSEVFAERRTRQGAQP